MKILLENSLWHILLGHVLWFKSHYTVSRFAAWLYWICCFCGNGKSLYQKEIAKARISYVWKYVVQTSIIQLWQYCSIFFSYKFVHVSGSKIKEGNFVGPQISYLIRDRKIEDLLNQTEKSTRNPFKSVI